MKRIFLLLLVISLLWQLHAQNVSIGTNDAAIPIGYGNYLNFLGAWDNSDPLWMARYNISVDKTELRMSIGDDFNDNFVIGTHFWEDNTYHPAFTFQANGNLGIGISNPQERLALNGNIRAKEVKVETANWPDYVFRDDYQLPPLNSLKDFIKQNGHLPEIPIAELAEKNGINLGEMNKLLLKKVEELTLYIIYQDETIKHNAEQKTMQDQQIGGQGKRIDRLEKIMNKIH